MHLLHGVYPFAFALMRINGRSAMPAPKTLPQNESPLSKAALKWLMKERVHAPPWELHLLDLAHWGLENKVEGEWPDRERPAVEVQVATWRDGLRRTCFSGCSATRTARTTRRSRSKTC